MTDQILETGAADQLGSVGRTVTGQLLDRGLPDRAMVRREDERAASLRAAGAQVAVGDLLEPGDVYRVVSGCGRVYFGMSVSAGYLEATVSMAAVAREAGVNALVNMSQMTVSEMSIQNTTPSHQQRQHWLGEQALAWSGLPVVTIRPTMFLESFLQLAAPSVRNRDRIELPFGRGKTSPVAAADVAQVRAGRPAPGRRKCVCGGDLPSAKELGRESVCEAHPLQQASQRHALRGVGTACALRL
jgi:NAD(P)H dehydrogenase (quinone)